MVALSLLSSGFAPTWPTAHRKLLLRVLCLIRYLCPWGSLRGVSSGLYFFLYLSHLLSFAGLPPTFSFSLSFSCSIFQICGHDNLSKFNTLDKIQRQFLLSVFVFIDSFVVSALQDVGGNVISCQNNLKLHLGCNTCWLSYFTFVCLWCGQTVSWASGGRCTDMWLPNFLRWVDYFIFLPMVLCWRTSRMRALL